jgi:hypothetical protein
VHSLREILDAIYYISSAVAVLGACCHMSFRLGKPSTTTSELGASMVAGSGCTLPCAIVCEYASREILSPVQALWIASSVKTTAVGAERGYDGGKKVKGRKRHLLVDTAKAWC